MTNMHPRSTNRTALLRDYRTHLHCNPDFTANAVSAGDESKENMQSFILRPGSVLYAPAGTWHKVDCDDEEGSLSINFSIDCGRWVDTFMSRVLPYLWRLPGWRDRVSVASPEQAST